jgi:hypothetical protein
MDQSRVTILLLTFLGLLSVAVSVLSILILRGGKFYQRIPENSRPRRWVVAFYFLYFVTFCFWFPAWFWHRQSFLSQVLGFLMTAFTLVLVAAVVLGKVGWMLSPVITIFAHLVETAKIGREEKKLRKSTHA